MSAPQAQQPAQPLDLAAPIHRATSFFAAPIGKKVVMAVTGVIWFGYVIGHLLGNLQIYVGAEQINSYARTLHELPLLLWGTRIVLSASIVLHVGAAIQLARNHRAARPIGYGRWRGVGSTYA